MFHQILRRNIKRKIKNTANHTLRVGIVFLLVFYQLALPLTIIEIKADEVATTAESTSTESNSNDNQDNEESVDNSESNENKNDNDNKEEPKETCDVKSSEITDYCQEKLDCDSVDKCLVKNSCGEIKKCISVKIENKDESEVNNNVNTSSNTGENEIKQEDEEEENHNDNVDNVNANSNSEIENSNENENSNINENSNTNSNVNGNSNVNTSSEEDPTDSVEGDSNSNTNSNDNPNANSNNNSNAQVDTGDAAAQSYVYNEVNTNIVSDNYQQTVINIEGTSDEDINLLEQFQQLNESNPDSNTSGNLEVNNINDADVSNDVVVEANTGGNTIQTENGDSGIQTGDATAISDTVNVINTNIVGNNVLFAVINVYGEWNGDLIVPGEGLLEVSPEPTYTTTEIVNENEADIVNNLNTEANTGQNTIESEGSGDASITTGSAISTSEVLNVVNTTIIQNNFFFLLINNLGSWTGKVLNWNEEDGTYTNIFSYDFGELADGGESLIDGFLSIFNKNTASVENNVEVSANTGDNTIESSGQNSQSNITTGNAYAQSRAINFVNTNIIGNNWMFGIVNVMGTWNGDAVFAYPDLIISISDGKDYVSPGENLTYQITYKNIGKAACKDAKINITMPSFVEVGTNLSYSLAGLLPGEEKTVTVPASVTNSIPEGDTNLSSAVSISTGTKEVELGNNTAGDSTIAHKLTPQNVDNTLLSATSVNGNEDGSDNKLSKLTISRDVKDSKLHAGKTAVYNIFVENTGETELHDVVIFDEMITQSIRVGSFSWSLGDLSPGKKLKIQYKLAINALAPSGGYTSTATGYGYDPEDNKIVANSAKQKISVLGNESNSSGSSYNSIGGGSFVEYYTQNIIGGICYLDHWPAEDLIKEANAAPPLFTGSTSISRPPLPAWIWLAGVAAYFLAVNWALFPKGKEILSSIPEIFPAGNSLELAEAEEENFEEEFYEENLNDEETNDGSAKKY